MTQRTHPQARNLCPHLAAAALWMDKSSRTVRRSEKRIISARDYGPALDHLLAL